MSAQQGASPGQAILMGQPSPTEGTGASTGVAGDKLQTDLTGSARTQMEGVSLDKQGALSGGREILKEDQPTWKEQAKTAAREAKDLLT